MNMPRSFEIHLNTIEGRTIVVDAWNKFCARNGLDTLADQDQAQLIDDGSLLIDFIRQCSDKRDEVKFEPMKIAMTSFLLFLGYTSDVKA